MNDIKENDSIVQEMKYILEVSQKLSEAKPLRELLDEIMESCKQVMNAEASSLLMYDEKNNYLCFQIATGEKGNAVKDICFKMGEGIAGWVAEKRIPQLIEDCYKDPRFNKEIDKQSKFRTRSMICVPMTRKDKLVGVIQVINKKNGGVFTERDLNIFSILASQCAISIENAQLTENQIQQRAIERELKTAREIQQNLLPSCLPEFKDLEISAKTIPAKEVGGDYFNIYKINENETLFFISDASGKSISAALIVSTIYSFIVTYFQLKENTFDLTEFVKSLNKVLIESTTEEKFATCWFGLFNHSEKKLKSVNAGHNEIFIFRNDDSIINLTKGGMLLGNTETEFEYEDIKLQKNDLIFFYSDGVTEAMDMNFEQYGETRLKKLIQQNFKLPTKKILNLILTDLKKFADEAEQSDDITFGIVRVG